MVKRMKIKDILALTEEQDEVLVKGWVRTKRDAKDFSFVEVNDGSCLKNIQVIANNTLKNYDDVKKITTGSSVAVKGKLVESKGGNQKFEIVADDIEIYSLAPDDFPLQKKKHTDEFLRTIAHLRPRTNKYGAAFRIRSYQPPAPSEADRIFPGFRRAAAGTAPLPHVAAPCGNGRTCEEKFFLFLNTRRAARHAATLRQAFNAFGGLRYPFRTAWNRTHAQDHAFRSRASSLHEGAEQKRPRKVQLRPSMTLRKEFF